MITTEEIMVKEMKKIGKKKIKARNFDKKIYKLQLRKHVRNREKKCQKQTIK